MTFTRVAIALSCTHQPHCCCRHRSAVLYSLCVCAVVGPIRARKLQAKSQNFQESVKVLHPCLDCMVLDLQVFCSYVTHKKKHTTFMMCNASSPACANCRSLRREMIMFRGVQAMTSGKHWIILRPQQENGSNVLLKGKDEEDCCSAINDRTGMCLLYLVTEPGDRWDIDTRLQKGMHTPGWGRHAWAGSRWCPCTAAQPCRPSELGAQQGWAATSCLLCAE